MGHLYVCFCRTLFYICCLMSPDEYKLIITEGIDVKADPQTIEAVGLHLVQGFTQVKAAETTGVQIAAICRLAKRVKKAYKFCIKYCKVQKRRPQ